MMIFGLIKLMYWLRVVVDVKRADRCMTFYLSNHCCFCRLSHRRGSCDLDEGGKPANRCLTGKWDDLRAMRHTRPSPAQLEYQSGRSFLHLISIISALFILHRHPPIIMPSSSTQLRSGKGICAMRGTCGKTSMFGADLPCPDDSDATVVSTRIMRNTLDPVADTFCSPIKVS